MSEDNNLVHIKTIVDDFCNELEKAYNSGDFRLLQEKPRNSSLYYKLLDEYEKPPRENPFAEEMEKAYKQEQIENLKEILYQEYEANWIKKNKREKLIKKLEVDFFNNSEKKAPLYKFMEGKSQEELAECFKKVYHYFATTYYSVDSYYPVEVKEILDMMIWSTREI